MNNDEVVTSQGDHSHRFHSHKAVTFFPAKVRRLLANRMCLCYFKCIDTLIAFRIEGPLLIAVEYLEPAQGIPSNKA